MSLIRFEPLRELDQFFSRYVGGLGRPGSSVANEWAPVANVSETDSEYLIKAELPEVKKEDVKVSMENGVITISGERKLEKRLDNENDLRIESFYGTFSRSFALPENIDAQGIRAESKDGVLRIRIPKIATPKHAARVIEVK